MNNRIKEIMNYKGYSSSELADAIEVQRSNVTHVLQGRNKPGFQFIAKLLETFPEINARWLITGEGEMLESGTAKQQPTLFSGIMASSNTNVPEEIPVKNGQKEQPGSDRLLKRDGVTNSPEPEESIEETKMKQEKELLHQVTTKEEKAEMQSKATAETVLPIPEILKPAMSDNSKKIEYIVIFYSDHTFRQYTNDNS